MTENIYIKSIEASQIYNKNVRDIPFTAKYIGMLPSSLQSLHLSNLKDFSVKKDKHDKLITIDIINVKFNTKVQNIYEECKYTINKLEKAQLRAEQTGIKVKQEYIDNLNATINKYDDIISTFQNGKRHNLKDIPCDWQEISQDNLRTKFYNEGFTRSYVDKNTGELIETRYVLYQRSGSKSRTGQCLFIKDSLYQEMHNWTRMGLQFDENKEYETFTNLLPYEALTSSDSETTVTINPNNIFVIDDVDSIFKQDVNVIEYNDKIQALDSISRYDTVKNSLYDGESLLESAYFDYDDKGQQYAFMLLRNHFVKTAAFNTNIQLFLKEHCPNNISYDKWVLHSDISGDILAKNIHMVTTPNSLKFLKFCKDFNMTKSKMWQYWKSKVEEDSFIWGIVKHEKQSKRGYNFDDEIMQQTSYQMINSIPFTKDEVIELSQFELDIIDKLKNDTGYYLQYLTDTANKQNANEMIVALANQNKKFIETAYFKKYRKTKINSYVNYCKKGKIRLNGDYCVLFGNCIEMLYTAIGVDVLADTYNLQLKDNEIYTTLHAVDKEYVMFRSPHTSPSNVLVAHNKHVPDIDKYFNLTNNIVCVNAIKFAFQDILSGCDYDSDVAVIFNHPTILEGAKRIWGKYKPCINNINGDNKPYYPTAKSMAEIDNKLCQSQFLIGTTVNQGQHIMSAYWDNPSRKDLLKKVDVATILSCICIDVAKKQFDIDIKQEVENLTKGINIKNANFMQNINHKKIKDETCQSYNCAMQYLYETFSNLKYAEGSKQIPLSKLLIDECQLNKANRHKRASIIQKVIDMSKSINKIHKIYDKDNISEEDLKEKYIELDMTIDNCISDIKTNKKMSADTMFSIISYTLNPKNNLSQYKTDIFNTLYQLSQKQVDDEQSSQNTFLSIFSR